MSVVLHFLCGLVVRWEWLSHCCCGHVERGKCRGFLQVVVVCPLWFVERLDAQPWLVYGILRRIINLLMRLRKCLFNPRLIVVDSRQPPAVYLSHRLW